MSYNRFFEVNEEQAFDFLENTINKIRTEEDIDTLTKLIKVFKKNVPFSMRKYVTAFLLNIIIHSEDLLQVKIHLRKETTELLEMITEQIQNQKNHSQILQPKLQKQKKE